MAKYLLLLIFVFTGPAVPSSHYVWVKDCKGRFVAVYADSKMTVPMTNPFLTNADGRFRFYAPGACEVIAGDIDQ